MTTDNPMLPSAAERADRIFHPDNFCRVSGWVKKPLRNVVIDEIRAAEDAAREPLEREIERLKARITLAVEATYCCNSCVRTWLAGDLDEDQQKRVQIIIDAARGGEKDG